MTFSNNPEKLSLFGGGCNENDRILDLYGGLDVVLADEVVEQKQLRGLFRQHRIRFSCPLRRNTAFFFFF